MKSDSIKSLLPQEKTRLDELSNEARDDSKGEAPGSERGDEEERLFVASMSEEDRRIYEGHKGLGNCQKAEVAWLEEMGCAYEEVDVRDFAFWEWPLKFEEVVYFIHGMQPSLMEPLHCL
jgi:hypothetical protein